MKMDTNNIQLKKFLGAVSTDLILDSQKYKHTDIEQILEEKFSIQDNKLLFIVDPNLRGYAIETCGNELRISVNLYKCPFIAVINSADEKPQTQPMTDLYNSSIFSTIAYLMCKNHSMFNITQSLDEPIYITHKSNYGTFYNFAVLFSTSDGVRVNIVEEIESKCALNVVSNYVMSKNSVINLATFYNNHRNASSIYYRNIIVQDDSSFNHKLFGIGTYKVIDENRIKFGNRTKINLNGVINSNGKAFNSITTIQSSNNNNSVHYDYKSVAYEHSKVTIKPLVEVAGVCDVKVSVKNLILNDNSFIMTLPLLKIASEDASCFHGVTNSTLDENDILYLMSRGMDYAQAKQLLINSFSYSETDIDSHFGIERYYECKNRFESSFRV
jgi:Fe-S cluster assembly scaffold protein SufB